MRTVWTRFQLSFNLFRATGRTRIGQNLYRGEQGAAETDLSLAGYQIHFVRACNNAVFTALAWSCEPGQCNQI